MYVYILSDTCAHAHTHGGTVRSNSASLIICRHHRPCVCVGTTHMHHQLAEAASARARCYRAKG